MKKRFSEEQIIFILKEADTGTKIADLCRKHNVSSATYYKWKAKFGGMNVTEAQRLRALEEENRLPFLPAINLLEYSWQAKYLFSKFK
jgi:putative transposase